MPSLKCINHNLCNRQLGQYYKSFVSLIVGAIYEYCQLCFFNSSSDVWIPTVLSMRITMPFSLFTDTDTNAVLAFYRYRQQCRSRFLPIPTTIPFSLFTDTDNNAVLTFYRYRQQYRSHFLPIPTTKPFSLFTDTDNNAVLTFYRYRQQSRFHFLPIPIILFNLT